MPLLATIPAILLLFLHFVLGESATGWTDALLWGVLPATVAIAIRQILYQITDWRIKPVIILTTIVHIVSIILIINLIPSIFDVWHICVGTFLFVMTLVGTLKYRYKSAFMLMLCMLSGLLLY